MFGKLIILNLVFAAETSWAYNKADPMMTEGSFKPGNPAQAYNDGGTSQQFNNNLASLTTAISQASPNNTSVAQPQLSSGVPYGTPALNGNFNSNSIHEQNGSEETAQ